MTASAASRCPWRIGVMSTGLITNGDDRAERGVCAVFPNEPVALYAGGQPSFVQRGEERRTAAREAIKGRIQGGEIRPVCATDTACEGLNLQRLDAQLNVDLPWNPRLEQRKGRIERIGQVRDQVHVVNLRYAVLGQLPDSFAE